MIAVNELRAGLSDVEAGLSDVEVDELSNFLQSRCEHQGGMSISMLDGYLTAVESCPEFVQPSEWLPRVWGAGDAADPDQERHDDDGVTFESLEEAKRMTGLVLRRMNEIVGDFEQATVRPIFLKKPAEDGEAEAVFAEIWCVGYLRGMTLHADAWEPLASRSNDASSYLAPIFGLALALAAADGLGGDVETPNAMMNTRARAKLTQLVPDAAYAIHQFLRDQRRVQPATIRREPQPGRNAVCPCGSGRKYKKCCGRA